MRIIKARAWNKTDKRFVYVSLVHGAVAIERPNKVSEMSEWELSTTVIDVKQKEVFENDIVRRTCGDPNCGTEHIGQVIWAVHGGVPGLAIWVDKENAGYPLIVKTAIGDLPIEVVGNIHQPSSLLQ